MALDTIPKQEGGKLKAVASGTLPSGVPVVVNSDGTVGVVGSNTITGSAGTPAVFETGGVNTPDVAFSTAAGKLLFAYFDKGNSNYGTAIVGTVSGTSISFGTAVVFESANTQQVRLTYDSGNDKFVIVYRDIGNSYYGTAVVATISGTSVSFGSPVVFNSALTSEPDIDYDVNAGKVLIGYTSGSNGVAIVGTVSGTSISFGSASNFNGSTSVSNLSYDSDAQKTVIAYRDGDNSDFGNCVVATISGTSVSFGSEVTFSASDSTHNISATYDSNAQKTVITFRDVGDSNKAKAIVGTISGTSISFGTAVVFNDSAQANFQMCAYDPYTKNVAIAYGDIGNSGYGTFVNGTVSGTTISFSSEVVFEQPGYTQFISMAADTTNNKMVVSYQDYTNSERGTACVLTSAGSVPNLTSENYIGMSGGVVELEGSADQAVGSPTLFENASTEAIATTFDRASGKVVIAYADGGNSGYGTAIVGTVSGTSISFGSAVVYRSAYANNTTATYDANTEKVVISYRDLGNSGYGTSIVGTVSGTSISFGTAVVFESADVRDTGSTYDSNSQKVVVTYRDTGNSSYGTAVVGTVSGTSISFGTPVVYETASSQYNAATFDTSNNKVVIAYRDNGTTHGTAIVGTVSGTSISFGTAVAFEASSTERIDCDYDAQNGKVVIAYQDVNNSQYCTAIVGTVSGTSISFGTAAVFDQVETQSMSVTYDETAQRTIISYNKAAPTPKAGRIVVCTVTGDSISFSTPVEFEPAEVLSVSSSYDSNAQKVVTCYVDAGNSNKGTAVVFQAEYENITRGSVADGDNATVDIIGSVSTNQLGLTAGQQYYVQTDGTVGTTPANPSVLAGTAVSATKMVVKS